MTNAVGTASELRERCNGQNQHVKLLNGRASTAEVYPDKLCSRILKGLIETMKKDATYLIPQNFNYSAINSLSTELRIKLEKIKPHNLDQASRIDGMTPVALTLILARIRLNEQKRSA